jgi:hypothetical protein
MIYKKPEVTPLGAAIRNVQGGSKLDGCCTDGTDPRLLTKPAYEADE